MKAYTDLANTIIRMDEGERRYSQEKVNALRDIISRLNNLMDCVYILDYHLKDSPVEMGAWVRLKSLLRGEHGVRL